MEEILINGHKLSYQVDRGKRKNVYILIENGCIIIKGPKNISEKHILDIIKKKEEWILKRYLKYGTQNKKKINYIDGEYNYFLGKKYEIKVLYDNVTVKKVILKDRIYIIYPLKYKEYSDEYILKANKSLIEKWYKEKSADIITKEIDNISNRLKLFPKEVKIRKFKRIWGNCSSNKVVKINQDVIFYNYECLEYVCLHELCHLKHMNHSKKFWEFLKICMPSYKEAVDMLKY